MQYFPSKRDIDKYFSLCYTNSKKREHSFSLRYIIRRKGIDIMTIWDELYFEITLHAEKSELKKFVRFLKSGAIDDFIEVDNEYIIFDDNYDEVEDGEESELIFTNDDYAIEVDEFDVDEFLEAFCKGAKNIELYGYVSDGAGAELHFTSAKGDTYYVNSRKNMRFNDELDEVAFDEEVDDT